MLESELSSLDRFLFSPCLFLPILRLSVYWMVSAMRTLIAPVLVPLPKRHLTRSRATRYRPMLPRRSQLRRMPIHSFRV
jgi:hypothetical protein